MALTVLQFVDRFPEFRGTAEGLIARRIAEAQRRTDPGTWGERADDGAAYLAAHLLSVSPTGEQARIAKGDQASSYLRERQRMAREVTFGMRVT